MFKVSSLDDFNLLRESSSIEFKLAGGRVSYGKYLMAGKYNQF